MSCVGRVRVPRLACCARHRPDEPNNLRHINTASHKASSSRTPTSRAKQFARFEPLKADFRFRFRRHPRAKGKQSKAEQSKAWNEISAANERLAIIYWRPSEIDIRCFGLRAARLRLCRADRSWPKRARQTSPINIHWPSAVASRQSA